MPRLGEVPKYLLPCTDAGTRSVQPESYLPGIYVGPIRTDSLAVIPDIYMEYGATYTPHQPNEKS